MRGRMNDARLSNTHIMLATLFILAFRTGAIGRAWVNDEDHILSLEIARTSSVGCFPC